MDHLFGDVTIIRNGERRTLRGRVDQIARIAFFGVGTDVLKGDQVEDGGRTFTVKSVAVAKGATGPHHVEAKITDAT